MARYTNEMRERAVRMVAEVRPEHRHETAALRHVAGLLGMNVESLRLWVHRAQVDAGVRPGREDQTTLGAHVEGRAAGARDRPDARGELRRLRRAEDARTDATSGLGHRPRSDRSASEDRRRPQG